MKSFTTLLLIALAASGYSFLLTKVTSAHGQSSVAKKKKVIIQHAMEHTNNRKKSCRFKTQKHSQMKMLKNIMNESLFIISPDHQKNLEQVKINQENAAKAVAGWKNTKQQLMLRKKSTQGVTEASSQGKVSITVKQETKKVKVVEEKKEVPAVQTQDSLGQEMKGMLTENANEESTVDNEMEKHKTDKDLWSQLNNLKSSLKTVEQSLKQTQEQMSGNLKKKEEVHSRFKATQQSPIVPADMVRFESTQKVEKQEDKKESKVEEQKKELKKEVETKTEVKKEVETKTEVKKEVETKTEAKETKEQEKQVEESIKKEEPKESEDMKEFAKMEEEMKSQDAKKKEEIDAKNSVAPEEGKMEAEHSQIEQTHSFHSELKTVTTNSDEKGLYSKGLSPQDLQSAPFSASQPKYEAVTYYGEMSGNPNPMVVQSIQRMKDHFGGYEGVYRFKEVEKQGKEAFDFKMLDHVL